MYTVIETPEFIKWSAAVWSQAKFDSLRRRQSSA